VSAFDIGRVCVKTEGRDAGKKCVIVDLLDKNFVMCSGPESVTGVRRRRVNMNHLQPLDEKLEIMKGASDEQLLLLMKK
jgi:large subunit ribosomal protein L14e